MFLTKCNVSPITISHLLTLTAIRTCKSEKKSDELCNLVPMYLCHDIPGRYVDWDFIHMKMNIN